MMNWNFHLFSKIRIATWRTSWWKFQWNTKKTLKRHRAYLEQALGVVEDKARSTGGGGNSPPASLFWEGAVFGQKKLWWLISHRFRDFATMTISLRDDYLLNAKMKDWNKQVDEPEIPILKDDETWSKKNKIKQNKKKSRYLPKKTKTLLEPKNNNNPF